MTILLILPSQSRLIPGHNLAENRICKCPLNTPLGLAYMYICYVKLSNNYNQQLSHDTLPCYVEECILFIYQLIGIGSSVTDMLIKIVW